MKKHLLKLLPFAALLSAADRSHATLYAYEGFDYPIAANGLGSQNGGTGFSGGWDTVANNGEILASSLGYTDGGGRTLITSGNMAQMDGSSAGTAVNFRTIDTSQLDYGSATTMYISFLGQKVPSFAGTTLDSRAINLALFAPASGGGVTGERVSVGHGTNTPAGGFGGEYRWGHFTNGNGANGQVGDATNAHYSSTNIQSSAFVVLRIDINPPELGGVNDRSTLYINPSLDAEPGSPSAIIIDTRDIFSTMTDFARLRPFGGNLNAANGAGIMNLDEIRIGTTWGDVTPFVPEPGTAALAALAGIALLRRRRA